MCVSVQFFGTYYDIAMLLVLKTNYLFTWNIETNVEVEDTAKGDNTVVQTS